MLGLGLDAFGYYRQPELEPKLQDCTYDDPGPPALGPSRCRQFMRSDLDTIADRIRRFQPSHRDPEQFHVEKDEIERELRQLARTADRYAVSPH
ncbi:MULTISPECIES: hypothetical protein [unclassified Methylobacterium]|uniref:hypothetical protein n=1 Tax=unclassified Methylobacterium TaxID=2615210 RepID=UPI00164FB3C9|nr:MULTISPECIES: hypothetical protein [unclassified Methylobacterium]